MAHREHSRFRLLLSAAFAMLWLEHRMQTLYSSRYDTGITDLVLAASEQGLVVLEFDRGKLPPKKTKYGWVESAAELQPYARELDEYFAGKRRDFRFPLGLRGTPFQLDCWNA